MRMTIGLEYVAEKYLPSLREELAKFAKCSIQIRGNEVLVSTDGDIVQCECVVAICDRYRFRKEQENLS